MSAVPSPIALRTDAASSAKFAGLRYVSGTTPGLRRKRAGRGFMYVDARGRVVKDPRTLDRIRTLVIPPAWRDVWVCPDPNGHLQVTGRDARNRKQYRYHTRWSALRDDVKYGRLIAFGKILPALRRQIAADLKQPPLSRARVLATVVSLLEKTLIRVGNEEYAKANRSFGLTTLEDRHVQVRGSRVRFKFRAKSGVLQTVELEDAGLAGSVKKCQDLPGQVLFQYLDADRKRQAVSSGDVNDYLRAISGADFTAKDFRTWAGTVLAACALRDAPPAITLAERKHNVVSVIDLVAGRLGNTRAVCRRCYVHPAVMDAYMDGVTVESPGTARLREARLSRDEAAALALLRKLERQPPRAGSGRAEVARAP
jgi:DNA topoisomerase I